MGFLEKYLEGAVDLEGNLYMLSDVRRYARDRHEVSTVVVFSGGDEAIAQFCESRLPGRRTRRLPRRTPRRRPQPGSPSETRWAWAAPTVRLSASPTGMPTG